MSSWLLLLLTLFITNLLLHYSGVKGPLLAVLEKRRAAEQAERDQKKKELEADELEAVKKAIERPSNRSAFASLCE